MDMHETDAVVVETFEAEDGETMVVVEYRMGRLVVDRETMAESKFYGLDYDPAD